MRHSSKSGKSASRLVADYFAPIDTDEEIPGTEIAPRVRPLIGSLKGVAVTEEDYRRHPEFIEKENALWMKSPKLK